MIPHRVPLLILLKAGFGLRVAFVSTPSVIEFDGAYYASIAHAMANGDWTGAHSTKWPLL